MPPKGEAKRQRIIDTANALFYERGYGRTSLAGIAQACGIPKGNFYFHFKTKDDILAAVVAGRVARLRDRLAAWEREIARPVDRLVRLSEMIVRDGADIVRHGCPTGSLATELGKEGNANLARPLFREMLDWSEAQFAALAGADAAPDLARRMLVRLQGASVLAHAFRDPAWLAEEQAAVAAWLRGL